MLTLPSQFLSVEELRDYIPSIPWQRIAHACASSVVPVCAAVRNTVNNDIDSLARLLVDLEVSSLPETTQFNDETVNLSFLDSFSVSQRNAGVSVNLHLLVDIRIFRPLKLPGRTW